MYITVSDMTAYGITGTVVPSLIESAEAVFNTLIDNPEGLLLSTKIQYFDANKCDGRVFYLSTHKPTEITSINSVSVGTVDQDYIFYGSKLELKEAVSYPSSFPYRYKVEYKSGYAENAIPGDIKGVIKQIVSALFNKTDKEGISNFKQDLLSISYGGNAESILSMLSPDEENYVQTVINKYRVPIVI